MKKFYVIIILILAGLLTFNYSKIGGFTKTGTSNTTESELVEEKLPLKIFIAADATGSLHDNGISKLTLSQLERIIDTIKVYGGQIGLVMINEDCGKSPLLRITIQKEPIGPIYPVQAISETAYNFGQRLQQYHVAHKKFIVDSTNYSARSIPQMQSFLQDAEIILRNAYAKLAINSDCVGAFNLSLKFHMEPVKNTAHVKHISIFVSDMIHDAPLNRSTLQSSVVDGDFYVVRSKKTQDCMPEELIYKEFENIDATLDHIL